MTYETKEKSGSLFKNNKKEKENHPDMTGEVKIEGKIYWASGWKKVDKNGNTWISMSFKEKDFTPAKEAAKATVDDFDDEIPF